MSATKQATESVTYVTRESYPADPNGEFDAVSIHREERVFADGRIESRVWGTDGAESFDKRTTRRAEIAIDFDRITAARLRAGWTVKGGA